MNSKSLAAYALLAGLALFPLRVLAGICEAPLIRYENLFKISGQEALQAEVRARLIAALSPTLGEREAQASAQDLIDRGHVQVSVLSDSTIEGAAFVLIRNRSDARAIRGRTYLSVDELAVVLPEVRANRRTRSLENRELFSWLFGWLGEEEVGRTQRVRRSLDWYDRHRDRE